VEKPSSPSTKGVRWGARFLDVFGDHGFYGHCSFQKLWIDRIGPL
jgi:hypothetical protein